MTTANETADDTIEMEQPAALYAADLLKRGREYLAAFYRLSENDEQAVAHPAYFLLAHTIELALKADLLNRGFPRKGLKQLSLRHDIRALLEEAEALGLAPPEAFHQLVYSIGEMNFEHDFRYPTGYLLTVPYPAWCRSAMEELLHLIGPGIDNAAVYAQVRWASETRHLKGKRIVWSKA
ncbi:MAG: hypothetical protein ABIQ30_04045 [Devosia sp.]